MDRRQFIKVTAITGASATLAGCGNPEHHLIRFLPDEELTPGVAVWKPSVCPLCNAGCGVLVRVMDGDAEVFRDGQWGLTRMGLAKKLEGNPAHPVNQGKLCVRGQAAIQLTYHPDRITQPLRRTGERGAGQYESISWDQALTDVLGKLDQLASSGKQSALACITRPHTGHRLALLTMFLQRFGAPAPVVYEVFGDAVLRRANELSFGWAQLPTFDFARSNYVLSFGADVLGTWNSPVAHTAGYGTMRQGRPGVRAKLVHVEPRVSPTGANADEWVPARPGTEGALALGLAHVIMSAGLRSASDAGRAGAAIEGWSTGLSAFAPAEVEKVTGVSAARIERLAKEFAARTPAVALIGGAPLAHTNGLFQALAVNALSALVGSVGQPGGLGFTPQFPSAVPVSPSTPLAQVLGASAAPPDVLLLDGANPVYGAPRALQVKEALGKVPFIVSFSGFLDDTSAYADIILPDHSFLESWVDAVPESGSAVAVASVAPPAVKPLYQTRAMPDVLLELARRLGQPLEPAFTWQTYDEVLRDAYQALPAPPAAPDAPAVDVWAKAQEQGGWWLTTSAPVPAGARPAALVGRQATPPTPGPTQATTAAFDGAPAEYPYHLLPYASQALLDGSLAHLPWLQELPDPVTSAMWSNWVELNPTTAESLQVAQGDVVEVTSSQGAFRAPVVIMPGIAPDVIGAPVGQGHETFTRYASGRGTNPLSIVAPLTETTTGAVAWAATRVKLSKVGAGASPLILFAGEMREHPHEHHGR